MKMVMEINGKAYEKFLAYAPPPPGRRPQEKKKTLAAADPASRGGMGEDTIPPAATVVTLPHKPT